MVDWKADLLALGKRVDEAALAASRAALEGHLRATCGASTDPYGNLWQPLEDGGAPLKKAFTALKFFVQGSAVGVELHPPYVFHHYGAGGSSGSKAAARDLRFRARRRAGEGGKANRFASVRRAIIPDTRGLPEPLRMLILKEFARKL